MLFEYGELAIEWVTGDSGQATIILGLILGIIYFRKAIGLGSIVASAVGKVVFTMGTLVVLLVTGIIPGIDIAAAIDLLSRLASWAYHILTWFL